MPYTLTFNTFIEKKPEHGENIVFLRKTGSFDLYGYELTPESVEYSWYEYDIEDDYSTGDCIGYDGCDIPPESEGNTYWRLHITVNGYIVDDEDTETDYLWMNEEDYFNSLPIH